MFKSIRSALGLLFFLFVLLVTVTVAATFWGLNAQKQDALVINLAGRQRMLVQQMARLALEIQSGETDDIPELQASMETFAATLNAFFAGGNVPYRPERTVYVAATQDPLIWEQLSRVQGTWVPFQQALYRLMETEPGSPAFNQALEQVRALAPVLVEQCDAAVRLYESASTRKVERLRWIQGVFLATALLLLLMGMWMVRRVLLAPLARLSAAAARIGQGDLTTPVQVKGPQEIRALAEAFEHMRAQLRTSQETLLKWGQELEWRVAQRTRELEALHRVSREISSRLDLDHVLRTITEKARELLDGEVAILCLLTDDGRFLQLQSLSGPVEAVRAHQSPSYDAQTAMLLHSDTALLCDSGQCESTCHTCRILDHHYRVSHLVAPLQVRERVIGTLCVGSSARRQFDAEDVDLLTRLANSAAIALENARLYAQAERLAALEERQRIAAEMHDGLAQTLSSIRLLGERSIEMLKEGRAEEARRVLENLRAAAASAIREVRRAITSLQQDTPLPQALQDELQALAARYQKQTSAQILLRAPDLPPVKLPEDRLQQVLRVAEEALRNAVRHSQATQIILELVEEDQGYRLTVQDNGKGFDPEQIPRNHFGLQIMQARAAHLDGHLIVDTGPGRGTRVTLSWPCPPQHTPESLSLEVS